MKWFTPFRARKARERSQANCLGILVEELRRLDPENPRLRFVEDKLRG